ncbi:alpha/beta fold hydrolase [Nocardia sp. BMG51109]|uniref:alpha/beta fold hydrolase n=1 Tax=Nocardia sp. BMG51109 TaxID=1056816 RepID=UPI000463E516|nr:alpha/beta fold hydrolase [Nocardia sp. BMG51109]
MKSIVSFGGADVHYSISGEGPGLVFVHGTSMDGATNFGHMTGQFTDTRTVVVPDYAGSGDTVVPDGAWTLDLLVGQVVAAARAAVDGRVDLVGFSLGAVIAAAVAARHPELVRRLVLVAGWAHSGDARLRLGLQTWARAIDTDPELATAQGPLMAFSPGFLSGLGDAGLAQLRTGDVAPGTRRQIDLDLRIDISDELPLVQAPTLVVGCTLDYLVPVAHSRALHAAIPGSRYVELDSGHMVFAEKPAELAEILRRFVLHESTAADAQPADVVRRYFGHIYAGEIDAAAAMLHPDFTWLVGTESAELTAAIPWAGQVWHGRDGLRDLVEMLFGEYESAEFQARDFYPVGGHVFVRGYFDFRHKSTRKRAAGDWLADFEVIDGAIRGGQFFENTYAVAAARTGGEPAPPGQPASAAHTASH